ncbi:tetratricopeptide repeat protein [Luteolibacter soli]|uniref:Tetratricopeptide repeat protein n=1 Tax=Luteolibacter soli TaxID=3135280 RepID=A0ABU9B3T4_9BACT
MKIPPLDADLDPEKSWPIKPIVSKICSPVVRLLKKEPFGLLGIFLTLGLYWHTVRVQGVDKANEQIAVVRALLNESIGRSESGMVAITRDPIKIAQANFAYGLIEAKDPNSVSTLQTKSMVLLANKDYEGARSAAEATLKKDPTNLLGLQLLGEAQSLFGNHEAALNAFDKILKLQPKTSGINALIGYELVILKQWDRALDELSAALRQCPNEPLETALKAYVLAQKGEKSRAEALAAQVLDMKTSDQLSYFYVGLTADKIENNAQMLKGFLAASNAGREGANIDACLGTAYLRNSNYREALPLLLRSLENLPDEPTTLLNLSECYRRSGDFANHAKIRARLAVIDRMHYELPRVRPARNGSKWDSPTEEFHEIWADPPAMKAK